MALTCPAGTALHELACIELERRPHAGWGDAWAACGTDGRRLVSLGELQTFRFRDDLAAPATGSEWADGGLDGGISPDFASYLTMNLGIPDLQPIANLAALPLRGTGSRRLIAA